MAAKTLSRQGGRRREVDSSLAKLAVSVRKLAERTANSTGNAARRLSEYCRQSDASVGEKAAEDFSLCVAALEVLLAYWRLTQAQHSEPAIELANRNALCKLTHDVLEELPHRCDIKEAAEDVATALAAHDIQASTTPLLGFLEPLMAAYDGARRKELGIYYTPAEVVNYLVQRSDDVLRCQFSLPRGIADAHIYDPAVGSAAFPIAVVRQACESWHASRDHDSSLSEFVSQTLLPGLTGCEIVPAAHIVANYLLAMELVRSGFVPQQDDRLRLQLGDALSEATSQNLLTSMDPRAVPVILGNPPYRGLSIANHSWISRLMRGKAPGNGDCASYFHIDGDPLGERKTWLHDDYVKFFRVAQWYVEQRGRGIVAFVTNHGFLDNPTFRGMRAAFRETFDVIETIDLHGNSKGALDRRDESVFSTAQGMALTVAWRVGEADSPARVLHGDLNGTRQAKLSRLVQAQERPIPMTSVTPSPPHYVFARVDEHRHREYEAGFRLCDIMPVNSTAPVTARDWFVVDSDRDLLIERLREFADLSIPDDEIRRRYFQRGRSSRYPPGDTRGWKLPDARERLAAERDWQRHLRRCWYRPFDRRWVFWVDWMIDWPRETVMRHLQDGNLALICRRQSPRGQSCNFFSVADDIVLDGYIRSDNRGSESIFPLYLQEEGRRVANIADEFVQACIDSWSASFVGNEHFDGTRSFNAYDLLHYFYALFHSPTYRSRYANALTSDFPRVLIPRRLELFRNLSACGARLVDCHLLRRPRAEEALVDYSGQSPDGVAAGYPKFVDARVYVRPGAWIEPVSAAAWDYRMGAHQVLRKWLKDRRGIEISRENVETYRTCVLGIERTLSIMESIDAEIASAGGWPEAFLVSRSARRG